MNQNEAVEPQAEVIIGWDTEYQESGFDVVPISHQFFVIDTGSGCAASEVLYSDERQTLSAILSALQTRLQGTLDLAGRPLVLVSHFSAAELGQLQNGPEIIFENGLLAHGGGYVGRLKEAGLTLELFDTNVLAQCSLEALGKSIGLEKVDIEARGYRKSRMKELLAQDRELFEQYALLDAEICARFFQRFTELCRKQGYYRAKTLGMIFEDLLKKRLLAAGKQQGGQPGRVDALGYKIERHTDFKSEQKKKHHRRLRPSPDAKGFQAAYYGGRSETFVYGLFPNRDVYDYDLRSAYNLAMACIGEWKWDEVEFDDPSDLSELQGFLSTNPMSLGHIRLKFRFKEGTRHPALPIRTPTGLVFPLEGKTVCTAQEFMVAYPALDLDRCRLLGVVVYRPVSSTSIVAEVGQELRELRESTAKGSAENVLLKLIANAGYGKFMQGLGDKTVIDTAHSSAERIVNSHLKESAITNPALASFITGVVRAVMAEYLLYFERCGVSVGSVTTDGFTLFDRELTAQELAGVGPLTEFLAKRCSEVFGTGAALLELKHAGRGFLAIKTRAYTMLGPLPGRTESLLTAVAGLQVRKLAGPGQTPSQFVHDEFQRVQIGQETTYRTSSPVSKNRWLQGTTTFRFEQGQRGFNWDYDLKRRPNCYTDRSFTTLPWTTVDEYEVARLHYDSFQRRRMHSNKLLWDEGAWRSFEHYQAQKTSGKVSRVSSQASKLEALAVEFSKLKAENDNATTVRAFAKDRGVSHSTLLRYLGKLVQ